MTLALADAVSVTAHLPFHSYDSDGRVFVQDDGSLGIAWRFEAVPCEGVSEAGLGALAARLDALIRLLPEGAAAAQFIMVSSRDVEAPLARWLDATTAPDGSLLRDLAASRVGALRAFAMTDRGAPFVARTLSRYLTVRMFPAWRTGALLSPARLPQDLESGYRTAKGRLLELASAIEGLLTQTGVPFARLDEDALVRLVRTMLGASPQSPPRPASPDRLVRDRMAVSHVDFDLATGAIATDSRFMKTLSAIDLPPATWAGMLTLGTPAVIDVVPESIVVLNVHVPDQEAVKSGLGRKKRLAFCQLSSGDVKVDMAAMKSEVDHVLGEMFMGGRVVSARVHVVVSDASRDGLESRARAAAGALEHAGFRFVAERSLGPSLFLQSLPLAYDPSNDRALKRGRRMVSLNLAHMVPAYGAFRGTRTPDLLLLNRRGEPVTLSFFDASTAPHGIVCGVTGAGKSVFANTLIANVLRRGSRVFVIDRGNSYRKLARVLGGEGGYVEFHPDRPTSINPCGIAGPKGAELTREKLIFLRDLVAEMATRGREDLAPRDQSLVEAAITEAFRRKPGQEVLIGDVQRVLAQRPEPSARDMALALGSFTRDGPYAPFFDRPGGVDFDRPFVVFELGDTALEKSVVSVLLMAIIHRITDACAAQPGLDKYVVVDEAWTLLRSKATARFIENVFRTYRKYRTSAVMVTQQVADFEGPAGEAIRANAPNRIYLRQTSETILAMQRLLDLSPDDKALLESLATVRGRYSEFLVATPDARGVARLVQDPLGYWVTTSDPRDNAYLDGLVARHGGSLDEALREAVREHPHGVSR